jgi:small multidrug resistance pump
MTEEVEMQKSIAFLLLSIIFNASANYVLKAYVVEKSHSILDMISSLPIYLAVIFFGINFLFYAKSLQTLKISTAYPVVVGMSAVIIIFLSFMFLNERLSLVQICGVGLIIAGVALIYI